jgi:uncharacterized protein (DUF58 family)
MKAGWLGWGLVVVAVAVGYTGYGWQGVALALTVTVFWLLLQFSRGVRALRDATGRPLGEVPSAVMLHSKLARGMRLPQVLRLTRSLGRPLTTEPEVYAWADAGGDEVQVELSDGRVTRWALKRAGN